MSYDRIGLWQRGLAPRENDHAEKPRERLRVAFAEFWENGCTLAKEIAKDIPGLTLHDEAHFLSLWDRADQIAGPTYELTPLEVFVLGGAILLHDTANCIAAYTGGREEIENTPEWEDALSDWLEANPNKTLSSSTAEERQQILLSCLRTLHAQQAENLAFLQFHNSATDTRTSVLPNEYLRNHLGSIIGLIAASHHWDIDKLSQRLNEIIGSLGGMPREWTVRPIVLACLMRCADATQLDQSRAPDFLFGLLKLRGLSELHWRAQNRITIPTIDPDDNAAMIFTSSRPYSEDDADAWWIAFDAIQVANRELQASNTLLRDLRLPPFMINRIRNAESSDRLSFQLHAKGWRPISADVKINRVDKIVDMFGGNQLYGENSYIPFRELIQNAFDAIRHRRLLEPEGSGYKGQIAIRVEPLGESDEVWIHVEDDGIGMSEAALTGPLIDFGGSYIASPLAKAERPGLSALGRRRVGRYGIGFFSVFMISDQVLVSSRPFDGALSDCRTLRFKDGLIMRPLLLKHRPEGFGASTSTRVSFLMSKLKLDHILSHEEETYSDVDGRYDTYSIRLTFSQLVRMVAPTLDVDIYVDEPGRDREITHSQEWDQQPRLQWLWDSTIYPDHHREGALCEFMTRASQNLDYIDPDSKVAGLAAISWRWGARGIKTIGGLLSSDHGLTSHDSDYVGVIDYEPSGPRRSASEKTFADPKSVSEWASRQAITISEMALSCEEFHEAAIRVAEFGGDPRPIARAYFNRQFVKPTHIIDRLVAGDEIFSPVDTNHPSKVAVSISDIKVSMKGEFEDDFYPSDVELHVCALEAYRRYYGSARYSYLPSSKLYSGDGIFGILADIARARGFQLDVVDVGVLHFGTYIGKSSDLSNLSSGEALTAHAVKYVLRSCE